MGQRIRLVLARDVRCGTMHRLKHARRTRFAQAGRGQHADTAGQHRRRIRKNVAKQVARDDRIELFRCAN